MGGKLFGVILNNVNIKTDDNYYYYAGYSTQYGYKKRAPRAAQLSKATAVVAPFDVTAASPEATMEVTEEPTLDIPQTPTAKVTFVRPPQGQYRF